jgi:hypothetical protein
MTPLLLLICIGAPAFLQAAPQDIDRWVRDLGSDDPALRKKAEQELRKAGTSALGALKRASADPDAERRARAQELVDEIDFAARGKIAFYGPETDRAQNLAAHALYVADPDAGAPEKVLGNIAGTYNGQWEIKWLPGRRSFAVSVDVVQEERFGLGVFPAIWTVDCRRQSPEKRTTPGRKTENGTGNFGVSPDGRRLAAAGWDIGGGSNLHGMDADGANPLAPDERVHQGLGPGVVPGREEDRLHGVQRQGIGHLRDRPGRDGPRATGSRTRVPGLHARRKKASLRFSTTASS